MNTTCSRPTLVSAFLLASAAGAFAGETLRYAPREGLVLEKKLTVGHELELVGMGASRDGSPMVQDGTTGWVSSWEKVVMIDDYKKMGAGRADLLVRTFDDLAAGGKATVVFPGANKSGVNEQQNAAFSSLQKRAIAFTWVESEQGWSRAYDRLEGDEALLAGLEQDADLAAAVPARAVKVGDTWDVAPAAARSFLAPGGALSLDPKKTLPFARTMRTGVGGDLGELLAGATGTIQATYKEDRKVDGVDCAVVEVRIDLQNKLDRTPVFARFAPESDQRDPARLRGCDFTYQVQGKGELLWDLAAGHFRSWEFNGDERFSITVIKHVVDEATTRAIVSQQSDFKGQLKLSLVASAPAAQDAKK